MADWFDRFFEEKQLSSEVFKVEHNGTTHMVESEFVTSLIKLSSLSEKSKIKDTLVRIDFKNGSVNDYLKFLAEAYVKTHY